MTPRLDLVTTVGLALDEATRLLRGRPARPHLEEVAPTTYDWHRHLDDPESPLVTITQAGRILGLRPKSVRKLLDDDRLPYVRHTSGARLMRRDVVEARALATVPDTVSSLLAGA